MPSHDTFKKYFLNFIMSFFQCGFKLQTQNQSNKSAKITTRALPQRNNNKIIITLQRRAKMSAVAAEAPPSENIRAPQATTDL